MRRRYYNNNNYYYNYNEIHRHRNNNNNYKEACLTMHQPWASLLVYGIKRIEGRSWPSPFSGRLWIHAASKVPDVCTIKAMEDFYREIYALDGVTDLKFPEHYPVSGLVGCVEIVGCLRREELARWKSVSKGVRLEALTDFCWLSEQPQKLINPLKMRGDQGVYNLEWKIAEAAAKNLLPVESSSSIKFPLPNPSNYYSLRPGSLSLDQLENKALEDQLSPSLIKAIDGAVAAATQYSKKVNKPLKDIPRGFNTGELTDKVKGNSLEENSGKNGVGAEKTSSIMAANNGTRVASTQNSRKDIEPIIGTSPENNVIGNKLTAKLKGISIVEHQGSNGVDAESNGKTEERSKLVNEKSQEQLGSNSRSRSDQHSTGSSLIFSSALRGIRPQ